MPLKEFNNADAADGEKDDYIVSIATANEHSVCVTELGRVYTTGHNMHEKLGLNSDTLQTQVKFVRVTKNLSGHHIIKVACSFCHTMVLTDDGRVFVWGG